MEEQADLREELAALRRRVEETDLRLKRLESRFGLPRGEGAPSMNGAAGLRLGDGRTIEGQIGEFWLGHVGIAALLLGIAFFITYPFGSAVPPYVQVVAGYAAAVALFLLSRRSEESYPFSSRIFFAGSLILLFFSTLRLHFYSPDPIVANPTAGILLLLPVLGICLRAAILRRSESLTLLLLLLGYLTGLLSESGLLGPGLITVTSACAVYLGFRLGRIRVVVLSVPLAYLAYLLWMFGASPMGRPDQPVPRSPESYAAMFACAALYGVAGLGRRDGGERDPGRVILAAFNAGGFFGLTGIAALGLFRGSMPVLYTGVSALFLGLAILSRAREQDRTVTALHACFGYLALSVAIVARFESPDRFIWLGWQSLLVMSTAIWFRSKIVVVANLLIYLAIFLAYLVLGRPEMTVNLSYAAVALLSARILNWRKERLTLKTEAMRNTYLASAFIIIPFGLYHGVPAPFVSLSWLLTALFYFAMSLVLNNRKYRWMAIWTVFLTILYVFTFDLARLNPFYRMISFIAVGSTLLAISWVYARHRRNAKPDLIREGG